MNDAPRPKARLYVDAALDVPTLGLAAPQAHYLRHVLRLDKGDLVAIFNGRDGEYAARIAGFGKGWCSLEIAEKRRAMAPEPDLWLVFAPIKRARVDFLAEKACELGVSRLWPAITRHTVITRVPEDRLRAIVIEAAEQCGRLTVPEVAPAAPLADVLARWPAERRLIFCDESGHGRPIVAALEGLDLARPLALLTGPEGGFAPAELDALHKLPFVTAVGLGPRVLRADTAAVAALAVLQAVAQARRAALP